MNSDYECLITREKIKCKRCKSDYLDGKICSASGFSLFCAAPEEYYAIENYCTNCEHHKNMHVNDCCFFEATPEDGFTCDCNEFKHA